MYPTVQCGLAQSRALPPSGRDTLGGVILGSLRALALPTVQAKFFLSLSLSHPLNPFPAPHTPKLASVPLGQPFSWENKPTLGDESRKAAKLFLTVPDAVCPPGATSGTAVVGTFGALDGGGGMQAWEAQPGCSQNRAQPGTFCRSLPPPPPGMLSRARVETPVRVVAAPTQHQSANSI